MPNKTDLSATSGDRLIVPIVAALAIKLAALTALYLAFFTPPPDAPQRADRAAILGLAGPR